MPVDIDEERKYTPETASVSLSVLSKDLEAPATSSTLADQSREDITGAQLFDDPNLDLDHLDDYDEGDDSPYPEVRCSVSNTDDPEMPASTLRAWTIGLILALVIPGVNQFYFFRYPAVQVGSLFALLIAFPVGRAWEMVVPHWRIGRIELNPGPFTMKEHVLIMVMASVGAGSAYATDVVAVQRILYKQRWSFAYQWMIVQSTQLIGFSVGGLVRRYLVSPPSMIWPQNLVYCALFNTLHSQRYSRMSYKQGMTRERFFSYTFIASFFWYWFPGYLFTGLSHMDFVTWIAPSNKVINQLFGYSSGLGMSLVTLDWAQIAFLGSPLATPWWAELNVMSGFVFFYWLLAPVLYYSNSWYSAYLPLSSRQSFDRYGQPFDVSRILNEQETKIDLAKYREYSPIFLPITFALSYGLSFASITSTLVHSFIYYRKQIMYQSRRGLKEQPDVHAKLMSQYNEVPSWWYATIFVTMFAIGVVSIQVWPTQMPVWAFIIALVMAGIYVIPIGMLQALTNTQVPLNVITELVIGYMVPGKPVAMMLFKTYGYISAAQALAFTRDLKLGHYMKIPPRSMFFAQVVATILAGTAQLGVQLWLFETIDDLCTPRQEDGFICPATTTFATASIVWGVIGPAYSYSSGQIYYGLVFFFLIGAAAPIASWLWTKRYPRSWVRYVNFPVFFSGTYYFPPASAINYVTWGLVGFLFQYVVRRRRFQWWAHYNYVLSAALDSGVAVATVVIFFSLQFPRVHSKIDTWWGNTVWKKTSDSNGTATFLPIPPEGFFGPTTW